jgi:hypothetical protein
MEGFCECLPNCSKALDLVERGCARDLSLKERLALKYHGRLCPFCACATGKFEAAKARMREAEAARRGAGPA